MIQPIDIPISTILNEDRYRYTTPAERVDLRRSISQSGIRTPIQVLQTQEGWIPFSGFSRLDAARELGLSSIPVEMMDSSQDLIHVFQLVLIEHRSICVLNLIEKSRIVAILDRMDPDWFGNHPKFVSVLDIPSDKIESLRLLSSSPDGLVRYVETFGLSLKQAEGLLRFDPETMDAAARFAFALGIRAVELLEILDWSEGISRQEGISIQRVLEEASAFVGETEQNRNQRLAGIKTGLFARRYPTVTAFNDRLSIERKALPLPESIRITWDPTLEQPGFRLDGTIRTASDLEKLSRLFSDPENIERFKRLIDW